MKDTEFYYPKQTILRKGGVEVKITKIGDLWICESPKLPNSIKVYYKGKLNTIIKRILKKLETS